MSNNGVAPAGIEDEIPTPTARRGLDARGGVLTIILLLCNIGAIWAWSVLYPVVNVDDEAGWGSLATMVVLSVPNIVASLVLFVITWTTMRNAAVDRGLVHHPWMSVVASGAFGAVWVILYTVGVVWAWVTGAATFPDGMGMVTTWILAGIGPSALLGLVIALVPAWRRGRAPAPQA